MKSFSEKLVVLFSPLFPWVHPMIDSDGIMGNENRSGRFSSIFIAFLIWFYILLSIIINCVSSTSLLEAFVGYSPNIYEVIRECFRQQGGRVQLGLRVKVSVMVRRCLFGSLGIIYEAPNCKRSVLALVGLSVSFCFATMTTSFPLRTSSLGFIAWKWLLERCAWCGKNVKGFYVD